MSAWEAAAEAGGPPSEGLGMRRGPMSDRGLVSESHSAVFDIHNESRFATVQSSGTRETGFHPHLGRPLDEARGGPNGGGLANGHGGGRGGGGADRLAPQESAMVDEVGITAQSQRAMKQAGRMCMGMSIPGTGHTAYVFDILTTNGERWKVTRRYSDFLDLNKKLIQVRRHAHACVRSSFAKRLPSQRFPSISHPSSHPPPPPTPSEIKEEEEGQKQIPRGQQTQVPKPRKKHRQSNGT